MPNPSKRKGSGFEREVVAIFQSLGVAAEKVPLSGAVKGGRFDCDVTVPVRGEDKKIECKRRAREFARLYGYLGPNFAAAIRDDRTPPLVVLRLEDFAKLIL